MIDKLLAEIKTELEKGIRLHGLNVSTHESYAILLEEMDELWDEIKKRFQDKTAIKEEAIQVSAMALKLIISMESK